MHNATHEPSIWSPETVVNTARPPSSLRRKITRGYWAIALLLVAATGVTLVQLWRVENMVHLGERVSEVFDTTLEVRRFERNYFLHRQATDLDENAAYVDKLRALLRDPGGGDGLPDAERSARLLDLLAIYQQRMADYVNTRGQADELALAEAAVRTAGKDVVGVAEEMAGRQRAAEREALRTTRLLLAAAVVALAVLVAVLGRIVSQRIVAPLREIEKRVGAVATAPSHRVEPPTQDREIVAITDACNRMLHELESRQRHLVRAEKLASLGTLLSGVAHELNNPLSNISTSCQILLEEGDAADALVRRQMLEQIDTQTERARHIVRALSDFTRERGRRREAVPLAPLLQQTLAFIRGEVPTPVDVVCDIADDIAVAGDPQRLQQVLLNLIRNAVEAVAGRGRVTVSARRRQIAGAVAATEPQSGCDLEGAVIDLDVADDGPGIAPAVLERIFDPFFTTKDVGHGMGLGLFITHEIIEEHDGCIAVSSVEGRGTCFHIRLPAAALTGGAS
jgi:two-component system NtrC family sensor kinase